MTSEQISLTAGVLLSLAFSYVPGLADGFGRLSPETKRLVMLGLLALVSAGAFGIACAGWGAEWGLTLTCDQAGAWGLLKAFLLAVIANQATYQISPRRRVSVDGYLG